MLDCYEILKVNKATILHKTTMKEWDEANVDAYIRRCYDEIVKKEVEIPRYALLASNIDKQELVKELELLEQIQELCDEAYKTIGTVEGRENYTETAYLNEQAHLAQVKNAALQEKFNQLKEQYTKKKQDEEKQKELQKDKYTEFREKYQQRTKRSSYNVLNIQEDNFEKLSFKEKIQILKDKKEVLLKNYSSILEQNQDFIERAKVSIKMNEIAEAYEDLERQVREKRYDHTKEYQPDLIKGMVKNDSSIENKIVIRQRNAELANENINNKERYISDQKKRNLRVKTIAKIGYQNTMNEKGWLYEYQVTRRINEKDETDMVVSPVSIVDILLDKKIGKDGSMDLYHFLADELFSEDTIKGAQKNAGFIGSIKQDKEGKYYLTLDENQFEPKEQEMLTATMICREKERQKSGEGR